VLTLSELANPLIENNWLFVFTREQNHEVVTSIQLVDISSFPESFNEFVLDEPTDVEFPSVGDYMYQCYQMPDDISTDYLDGFLVEVGKVRVFDTEETLSVYDAQITNRIYEQ